MTASQQTRKGRRRPGPPANDNSPKEWRILVGLDPRTPVGRVEVEVFDLLIGRFDQFAAVNDNDAPGPHPDAIRGPPNDITPA